MARGKAIRRKRKPTSLGAVEAAFWLVLALAVGVAGPQALAGLPALVALFVPNGIMAAHAGVQSPSPRVNLPLDLPHAAGPYAPQVLAPVASRGFPDWLVLRIAYARLASDKSSAMAPPPRMPVIAIVIDDLGLDVAATRRAIALPRAVTLSFLPYGDDTPALAHAGTRAGHQLIVHVPMEPEGDQDPGPMALRTDLPPRANLHRLDWALSRVPGYAGINNHMGSLFSQDRRALIPVMERLAGSGTFFFDSRTTPNSVIVPLARAFGVESAGRDVFLDDRRTPAYVAAQLAETERIAREQGVAIAIGHPHAVTLRALKAWTAHVVGRGYRLVRLSTAIRMKTEQAAIRMTAASASTHH